MTPPGSAFRRYLATLPPGVYALGGHDPDTRRLRAAFWDWLAADDVRQATARAMSEVYYASETGDEPGPAGRAA